jgi:outer membrane protein assembly factor BamB
LAAGLAAARAGAAVPSPARAWLRSATGGSANGTWALPAHDFAATRHAAKRPGLSRRWSAHFPGGVPASAAIADGVVYAASAGGAVAALRLTDGTQIWRQEFGTATYGSGEETRELGFFSGVALTPTAAIVASDRVRCLARADGATLWEAEPLRSAAGDDYFWGLPTVVGEAVLVGSGSGAETPTAPGRLSAYRVADGALLWSTATVPEGGNGGGVIGPASVDPTAGLAYIATGAPYRAVKGANPGTCSILALNLGDGTVVWQDQVFAANREGFDFNSAPMIIGNRLVATNKAGVYAWDRTTRKPAWKRRLTFPLPIGEEVAVPFGGPEGGPIATDGRQIYVLSNNGQTGGCLAAALRPGDGRVLWRSPTAAWSYAAPAVAGNRLYVSGEDGIVRALETRYGLLREYVRLGEPSTAAPVIAAGHLVVGTGAAPYLDGEHLVCLGPN